MNNLTNSIPSILKEDTLVNDNMSNSYSVNNSLKRSSLSTQNNIINPLIEKESSKESNEIQDEEDFSQLNYKTIYLTENLDIFNDKKNRESSNLILPSALKISKSSFSDNEKSPEESKVKSAVECKDFIEGLEKYSPMTSSPINQKFNSEMFNKKQNIFTSSSNSQSNSFNTVNNALKANNISPNQLNTSNSLNFSRDKSNQKMELENDEISYVIGSDSTSSYIPFEESLLSDEMKRQSYCSISSDPNYRLSISSISNIDLNNKRQSIYSNSSNTNNTNSSKTNLQNISSEIIQVSSFTPPTSPIVSSKSLINNNNIKTNMKPSKTILKSSNSNNPVSLINNRQIDAKDDKPLYDRSILRPVSSLEVKEEKPSIDKSFFSQIEKKDDSVPFDRSFLRSIETKEEKVSFDKAFFSQLENKGEKSSFDRSFLRQVDNKENKDSKIIKDEKTLYDRTSLRQVECKNEKKVSNEYSKINNSKSKSKDIIIINTKADILNNDIGRGRPVNVNVFKDNIFTRRSHSQGSNASSPISKEITSPTEIRKINRRKNRTSDPCTPTSLRHNKSTSNIVHNKSTSNIVNISSTLEVPLPERMESLPLKSKVNRLKNSENGLRRSSSYSCIQMSSSTSPSSTIIDIRPPLKSSSSMILSSNIKMESTKLNPLVNSDEETQTPQKVIENLNKLNVESRKTTMSDIPKIIFSMAQFVGVILVDKTNQLLCYFEERYPKLGVIISILQVITRYIPNVAIKSSEIIQQGYRMLMNRIRILRDYCESNNIPFPDVNQFIRLFNILKNQIIEKIMLAKDGQLQLPSNISVFMSRIQEILNRSSSPKKGRLPFSKSDIHSISISGPVGGHPMGSGESFKFDSTHEVNDPTSTVSITIVQDDREKTGSKDYNTIKKMNEPQEMETEIISLDQKAKVSSPSSTYDESIIITKSLSTDTTVKDGSFPFFKRRQEKGSNKLSNDINSVDGNRNSYQSSESSFISDSSHNSNINGKRYGMVGVLHHQHQNSTTSSDSVTEPIVKENVNVNNLIELFEKQMSQAKIPNDDSNENESFQFPSQPPQTNPRTHSLKYSIKQRQQKTSSIVSDDMVSISTSDSSEFDKVDFEDNIGRKPTVNLNYTSGHRRSHSQPDDSFLEDQDERENEISLSQEVSSELRHKFTKGQEGRERYKEPLRSQSMYFTNEKSQKSGQNELLMVVKNLKPVSSSTRLSVPSTDIRNSSVDKKPVVEQERISGSIPVVNSDAPAPPTKSKREKIVEELFQTEKTYVKELASIVHLYLDPLDTVPGHFLDMQEYKTLFGNLRDIFDFHNEAFAPRLEKSCFPERNKSIVPPPSVGSFFQLNAPVLANLYGEYYTNSNMANNFLTRIQNSKSGRFSTSLVNNKPKEAIFKKENKKRLKKFKTFLQWVCGQPEHTQMSLQGYLLLPVQRLPRYLLLLEQLLKNTSETDKEYRDLNKAKEAIRMVVEQCNERIRHFEEKQRVIEIISNIRLCSSNVHSIGGKVIKYSSGSHNKRLLLDTVPAKTKVEFFVKLQNLTKLDELHLIKEGRFQIYKVKQCDPKSSSNKKGKNNRREPSDFTSSPALRAQRAAAERIAQRAADKMRRKINEKESHEVKKTNEGNNEITSDASAFSPSLNSISPMIYNTVMKMSMSPNLRPTSTSSAPPSSSIRRRKTRRRSSLESLSPPFIKMLQEDKSTINDLNKINRHIDNIQEDENVTENRKRSLSTTVEDKETDDVVDTPKHHSMSTMDMKESLSLITPSTAIWEQVYLINNNLVEVLSSTNELVRIMELVKPKVGHLPNSILNPGCQVDVIVENGIQMLTVCDGHVMIYLMGLKNELFEWKEAIEKIIQ